jgi:DNA ligase-1
MTTERTESTEPNGAAVPAVIDERYMTLAMDWDGHDVTGWYMQEKLDGCRAYWDGATMWTRNGNAVAIPALWRELLPKQQLDGEIWCGRGNFTQARLATQYGKFEPNALYAIYDAPAVRGDYAQRMTKAVEFIQGRTFLQAVNFRTVQGTDCLERFFREIVAVGGEGVMLRNPSVSQYERGCTRNLMRVKNLDAFAWARALTK